MLLVSYSVQFSSKICSARILRPEKPYERWLRPDETEMLSMFSVNGGILQITRTDREEMEV